jgi:hypothetical protein
MNCGPEPYKAGDMLLPGNRFRGLSYHVLGGNALINSLFDREGARRTGMDNADMIVFQGGTDVDPKLYGDDRHPKTDEPDEVRDRMETALFRSMETSKFQWKIGICRGAQFLNVMNGGKLWQDIPGHRYSHELRYINEADLQRTYLVSSTHHQMMIPHLPDGIIWAYANQAEYREHAKGGRLELGKNHWRDAEIVYYPKTKSLCFQPHPEYLVPADTRELFVRCINRAVEL